MKRTCLYESHVDLKAKLSDFAGYEMPIQYAGVKSEVIAVRENVGVFDVSHMGEFFVTGPDAIKFVDHIITNDFVSAETGKAVYSPLCRENGTVIDDLIAYKLEEENILICVNAANIEKDWNWISSKTEGFNIELTNKSEDYSLLAVQGPKAEEVLSKIGFINMDKAEYYSAFRSEWNGSPVILARTGYTGEDGFEVFANHETTKKLWDELLNNDVIPCGLAARDVLRVEVCYPLYGHELNDELTPLDAALKWTVKTKKENFIGKEALDGATSKFRLVKLSLDKGIPRDGYPVLNSQDEVIGKITSGTMSVTTGKGVGLALVERSKFPENKEFKIQVRKNIIDANYHTKAFVNGGHK